mmetsp:Transcript_32709/g.65102  ORF Transcript_32709/g.65102 Transcript_32709/m.65102 type:complete len:321 (+) Transcript_32709:138-1100(+)
MPHKYFIFVRTLLPILHGTLPSNSIQFLFQIRSHLMPFTNHFHTMIVIGSPRIDILPALLTTPPGTIPWLSTIRKMKILNQCQIRKLTIFTPLDVPATLAMQIFILGNKIRDISVKNIGTHVIVPTSIQFHRRIRTYLIVEIGRQTLHGHRPHDPSISLSSPSILPRKSTDVIPLSNHLQILPKHLQIGLQNDEPRLKGRCPPRNDLMIIPRQIRPNILRHIPPPLRILHLDPPSRLPPILRIRRQQHGIVQIVHGSIIHEIDIGMNHDRMIHDCIRVQLDEFVASATPFLVHILPEVLPFNLVRFHRRVFDQDGVPQLL